MLKEFAIEQINRVYFNENNTIALSDDTFTLTPNDAEVFFNEIMNLREANEALKEAMFRYNKLK